MDPDFWNRLEAAWPKESNSAVPSMNVPQGKGLDAIVFRHASSWLGIAAEHLKYHTGYTLVWIEFKKGVDTKMLQNQDIYTVALRGLREYHSFDEASMIPYLNKYHAANYSLFHDISSHPSQSNTHALSPEIVQALVKASTGVSMVPVAVDTMQQTLRPEEMQANSGAEHKDSSSNWKRELVGSNKQQAMRKSGLTNRIERLKSVSKILGRDENDKRSDLRVTKASPRKSWPRKMKSCRRRGEEDIVMIWGFGNRY